MADVWISLLGHDADGVPGDMQNPYRTLGYAIVHNPGANRFILSNAGGDPTSTFEELPILFASEHGVVIYAEEYGTVFVKTPKISLDRSTVSLHGVVFQPADASTEPVFLSASSSTVSFLNSKLQGIKDTGMQAVNSTVDFSAAVFEGSDESATLLVASGNTSITYNGGMTFTGVYAHGAQLTGLNKFEGNSLVFEGEFTSGLTMDLTGIPSPQIGISDTKIDNRNETLLQHGMLIQGAKNENQVISIYRTLIHHATKGIHVVDSELELDKVTLDACETGLHAFEASIVTLSNSTITNCTLGIKAETASTIQYQYTNFYNNTFDFESDYTRTVPPEQFRLYLSHPTAYELVAGNIKANSDIVTAADQPGLVFARNTDYIFDYGSDVTLGKISRVASGNIPEGQLVNVSYEYKNFNVITGSVIPGVRIRHVDPRFSNITEFDYTLNDDSPLIEAGLYAGRSFIGTAPDIGYYERTRTLSPAETVLQLNLKSKDDVVTLEPDVANTILLQVENIKTYEPQVDVSEGSAVRDLLIKPAGHLLDGPRVERQYLMDQQSILNYQTMSAAELDMLAGNYFIERRPGQYATGTVRLYLSRPVDITVPVGTEFTNGTTKFVVVRDQFYLLDEVAFNVDRDMYYIDVPIQATEKGDVGLVLENTIRQTPNFTHPNLIDITNPDGTQNGENEETNAELYARLTTAWSTRALVSPRSITAMLSDRFAGIRHMTVVGAKDPYMQRDILTEIRPYVGDYHTFGRIDVYVMPYDHREVSQNYETDATGSFRIDEETVYRPIIHIKKLELLDINNIPIKELQPHEYSIEVDDENYRFSISEKMTIKLLNVLEYGNSSVKLTYITSTVMKDIQDYCNDDSVRNICTDILVKHYVPKVVSTTVTYLTNSSNDLDDLIAQALKNHVNAQTSGQDIGISTFAIPILGSGATTFTTPMSVVVHTWHQTGLVTMQAIEDEISCSRIEHLIEGDITATKIE